MLRHSALYEGVLTHKRHHGPAHGFRYPLYMLLLDLDEIPSLDRGLRLFGWNRSRPVDFRDEDHFGGASPGTRERLAGLFRAEGIEPPKGRVLVLTHPRVFGYVFNPVSFWWCFDQEGRLAAAVAEVNNTFGDRHAYVLPASPDTTVFHSKKVMHVSPFFAPDAGTYRWELPVPGETAELGVDLTGGGENLLSAGLRMKRLPLTDGGLLRALLRYPFMTLRVTSAIHLQALRLWAKGAPSFKAPRHDPQAARRGPA